MEEKKIIIDVTWKTAFSIWWKFFVINLVALLVVWWLWTLVNFEPTTMYNTSTYSSPQIDTKAQDRMKYSDCIYEKLNNNEDTLVCNKFLSPK